jgi:hypothetical protein
VSGNSSEISSEAIDSLIEDLSEPDYTIDLDPPPKTFDEAAKRLDLSAPQSAKNRLTRLTAYFDPHLLKNGDGFTELGWELMKMDPKTGKPVKELWDDYQKTIAVEHPQKPEILEAELIDAAEVAGTLALRASTILSTIEDAETPTFNLRQNYDGMMAVAAAIGEQTGDQMAIIQFNATMAAYQARLTQMQMAVVK